MGAKLAEPATIESMIASPSARAVASTAAATIAGRAVRTEIVQVTRQRLAPSAAAPSVQLRGTARSASTTIAIMIGTIITVRIRTPTMQARAVELDDVGDRFLALDADQVVADEGDDDEDPDQPVDDRGHRRQQPHHRLQHPVHPRRRELDDEDRREEREDDPDQHRPGGDHEGPPEQRPGVQRVDVVRPGSPAS